MTALTDILRKVRRTVVRRGGADEADDIVQEAFARLEAYTRAHEVRSQEAFLTRTAVNIVRDRARRQNASPFAYAQIDAERIVDGSPDALELLQARERLRRMASGLEQLPETARRCLLAHRLEGMTCAEIARREGLSVSAVEKQVARSVVFLTRWTDGW